MSKVIVIVSEIKKSSKRHHARTDTEIFNVDMSPLEVKELLQTSEQNIADLKMGRFKKKGDSA